MCWKSYNLYPIVLVLAIQQRKKLYLYSSKISGIVYQLFGDPDAALKVHHAHLNIARQMHDKAGMGRAYGNIGNAYR